MASAGADAAVDGSGAAVVVVVVDAVVVEVGSVDGAGAVTVGKVGGVVDAEGRGCDDPDSITPTAIAVTTATSATAATTINRNGGLAGHRLSGYRFG